MDKMPVLFVGHGSPMNAIEDNVFSRAHAALASLVQNDQLVANAITANTPAAA